ncbi:hypothetical protein KKI21_02545 [Patescibacteria group bacterium]|nr:hypothetical protein [Patescibacteria group bacterium]
MTNKLKTKEYQILVSDIEFRSERREVCLSVYEDLGYLIKLNDNKNQVIFGRRGSGKTHLLGSFVEYVNKEIKKDIAIYIDLKDIANEIVQEYTIDQKSYFYFWEFVEKIAVKLREEIINRLSMLKANSIKQKKLYKAIVLIDNLLTDISEEKFNTITGNFKNIENGSIKIDGFSDGGKRAKEKKQIKKKSTKDRFEEIIKISGTRYLFIAIDEWISFKPDMQPRFANMLNKAFINSKVIALKIGTIKYRTRFYLSKKNLGLELGSDIFSSIDLDINQMWERGVEKSIKFFSGILIKHLNYSIKKLKLKLDPYSKSKLNYLFASDKAFVELVKASEGIPRDFLNIFKRSYDYFLNDIKAKKITIRHIKSAVSDWYQDDKISALDSSSKVYKVLENLINNVIIQYKTKQFILPTEETANKEIQSLIDLRLLHLLKQGWSSKGTPGKRYNIISIDYGAFIAILETKIGKEVKQLWSGDDPLPEVNLRDIRRKEFSIKDTKIFKKSEREDLKTTKEQLILPLFKT